MKYNDLLEIYRNNDTPSADNAVKKLLSPSPLKDLDELEQIISTRFRYTGPGKWVKIIREAANTQDS